MTDILIGGLGLLLFAVYAFWGLRGPLLDVSHLERQRERQRAELENERGAWELTATQAQENADFYRGILRQIGRGFGNAAFTSDDGSIQDDVIVSKLPELVRQLRVHADFLGDKTK